MEGKLRAKQALEGYLRQGEQVRWQSGTAPFPLLEKGEGWKIVGKWIGTVAVTAALLALYTGQGREWSAGAVALILLIAVLLLLSPVIERRSLLGQRYWITDQRAILMTKDRTFYYMELMEIDDFQLLRDRTAGDCLILGGCLFEEVDRQLRWRACHPKTDIQNDSQRGLAQGLAFFSRESNSVNAKSLLGLLSMRLEYGMPIDITAEGVDAEEALSALEKVLNPTDPN